MYVVLITEPDLTMMGLTCMGIIRRPTQEDHLLITAPSYSKLLSKYYIYLDVF